MGRILFFNGNILTMDESKETVEAILVENDKIFFCGDYNEAAKYIDSETEQINLYGRTLLPGFNDSHMHLISYSLSKFKVNLLDAKSIEDVQKRLNEFITNEKTKVFGDWILGHGWNHENFREKRLPNRYDIDKIISDRPVYLSRACYHIGILNSKALELIGVDKNTNDPQGGVIDKDPITGEPTGILRENAMSLASKFIPMSLDVNTLKELILAGVADANKAGITSIQTDDFPYSNNYEDVIKAYNELKSENRLNCRVNLQLRLENVKEIEDFLKLGVKTGDGDEYVRIGPLKVIGDGSLGSRTASLMLPYSDDDTTNGVLIYKDKDIEEMLELAYTNDLQLAVHAIGDRCMHQVLGIYEKISKKYPKSNARFRIIHCQIASDEILSKFAELDVIADIQPVFVRTDYPIVESRVGVDRAKWSYSWKTMKDRGISLSGGSDSPVEPFDPILGIYAAVTRQDFTGKPNGGWLPEEKLGLFDSMKLFTTNSAYSTFEENIKGKLKEGMLADIIILSENIMRIESNYIKDIEVDLTMVGGKVVYRK